MQIRDVLLATLQRCADLVGKPAAFRRRIDQYPARLADQAPRPAHDDQRADDAHQRVGPEPAIAAAEQQGDDSEDRGQCIGQHMQIGGAQIVVARRVFMMVVVVMIVMVMRMAMVVMRMIVPQQPGADEIDGEPSNGDGDRLLEADRDRIGETHDTLPADEKRNQRQHDGARKTREVAEFSRAEGEARIARMAAGIGIGQRRDQHGTGMGGHVPTIRHQRHGAIERPGDDLRHHHARRQRDDEPDPSFVTAVIGTEKDMIVGGHGLPLSLRAAGYFR